MKTVKKLGAALMAVTVITTTGITASAAGRPTTRINVKKVDDFGRMISGPILTIEEADFGIDLGSVTDDGISVINDTDSDRVITTDGEIQFIDLYDGDYTLSETVPDRCHFTKIDPIVFSISAGTVTLGADYDYATLDRIEDENGYVEYTLTIVDQAPTVKFDIAKVGEPEDRGDNPDTGGNGTGGGTIVDPDLGIDLANLTIDIPVGPSVEPLSDVEFTISDGENKWIITTDEYGQAVSAELPKYGPDGKTMIKYTVKETKPKDNSYIVEDVDLAEGAQEVPEGTDGNIVYYINVLNTKRAKGTVEVLKLEEGTQDVGLEGAVFEITGSDGSNYTVTTGADGTGKEEVYLVDTVGNPINYKAIEISAPTGYELNSTEYAPVFNQDAEGKWIASITAYNKKAAIANGTTTKPDDKQDDNKKDDTSMDGNKDTDNKVTDNKDTANKVTTTDRNVKKASSVPNTADMGK